MNSLFEKTVYTQAIQVCQKQLPYVFFKESCSEKFRNIHRKIFVLESLFNIVGDLQERYLKETPIQVFSCEYCKIFKNTYFEEHLQMAALVCGI